MQSNSDPPTTTYTHTTPPTKKRHDLDYSENDMHTHDEYDNDRNTDWDHYSPTIIDIDYDNLIFEL